ncbi:hypothetical protein CL657_05645 [bacterium]|nr:hypothetical protein [bacterium]
MACPDKLVENPKLKILFSTVYSELNDNFPILEADWNDSYALFFERLEIKTADDLKSKLQMTFPEALFSLLTFKDTPLSTSQSLQLLTSVIINIRPILTSNRTVKLTSFLVRYPPDSSLEQNLTAIWNNLTLQVDFCNKNHDLHTFLVDYHTILYDLSYHIISEYIYKTPSGSALSLLGKLLPPVSNHVFSSWLLSNHYELNNHFDFFNQDYKKFLQSFENSFESLQKTLDCISILSFLHSVACSNNQKLYLFFNNHFIDSSSPVKSIEDISNKIFSLTKDRSIPATVLQKINDSLAFLFKKPTGTSTVYLEYFFDFLKSLKTADDLKAYLFRLIPSNTNTDSECVKFFTKKKLALKLINDIDCNHDDVKNVILSLKYYSVKPFTELNSFFPYESSNPLLNSYTDFYLCKHKYLQKFSGREKGQLKTYNFPEKTRAYLEQFDNFYTHKQKLLKEFSGREKKQLETYNFPEKTRTDLEYFHNFYTLKQELLKLYHDDTERLRYFDISKDSLDDLKEYQSNKFAEELIADTASPTPSTKPSNSKKKNKKKNKNKPKVLTSAESNQTRNQLINNWTSSKKELYDLLIKNSLLDQPCGFADIDSIKTLLGINDSQKISYKSSGTEMETLEKKTIEFQAQTVKLTSAINKHNYDKYCKKLQQIITDSPNLTPVLNKLLSTNTFSRPITEISDLRSDPSYDHSTKDIKILTHIYDSVQSSFNIITKYSTCYQALKTQITSLEDVGIQSSQAIDNYLKSVGSPDTFSQLDPSLVTDTEITEKQRLLDSIQASLKDIFIESYQFIYDELCKFITKKDDLYPLLTCELKQTILTQLLEKSTYFNNRRIKTLTELKTETIRSCDNNDLKDSLNKLKTLFGLVQEHSISSVAQALFKQCLNDCASLPSFYQDPSKNNFVRISSNLQTLMTKLQQPITSIDDLTKLYNNYQQLKTECERLKLNPIQAQLVHDFNTPLSPIPNHIINEQVKIIIFSLNLNTPTAQLIKKHIQSGATVYIYGSCLFKQNYNDVDILILDQNTKGIATEKFVTLIEGRFFPVDLHIANIGTYDPAIIGRTYNESVVAQLMIHDNNQLNVKGYYSAHASALSPNFDTFNHHTSFYGPKHQIYLLKRFAQLIHKHKETLLSPSTCNEFFNTIKLYHDNEPPLFTVIKNAVKTILMSSNTDNSLNLKTILKALDLFKQRTWLGPDLVSEFSHLFFKNVYQDDLTQAIDPHYKYKPPYA